MFLLVDSKFYIDIGFLFVGICAFVAFPQSACQALKPPYLLQRLIENMGYGGVLFRVIAIYIRLGYIRYRIAPHVLRYK